MTILAVFLWCVGIMVGVDVLALTWLVVRRRAHPRPRAQPRPWDVRTRLERQRARQHGVEAIRRAAQERER